MSPADDEQRGWGEGLTTQERDGWRRLARLRRYSRGDVLLREGEPPQEVLLVDGGLVKAVTMSVGGGSVVLAVRGQGEILGEIAALDGGGHSATVTALGEVDAHALGRRDFMDFLRRYPRVPVALLLRMSRRLREADRARLEYGTRTVLQRLASRLLALGDDYGYGLPDGSGVRVEVRLTQPELASSIAASREAVVKALRELRDLDAVQTEAGHRLVLRDPELLRGIAESESG